VPAPQIDLPSKGEINRCGELLSAAWEADFSNDFLTLHGMDKFEHAIRVLSDFRAAHQYPLTKATMGLRSMVSTEGCQIVVSQRLKRLPRIIRKLHRMPGSNLARLEDVGGCRAVLTDLDELYRVQRRLKRNWDGRGGRSKIVRERDYIADPKDIGYRAIHVVVERDGRRIEVQLRTERQQRWADAVETIDARLNMTVKDGLAPDSMIEFFAVAGNVQYVLDCGEIPADDMMRRLQTARERVVSGGYYAR